MQINLIAIGQQMPTWVDQGFQDYQERLTQDIKLKLIALPGQKRGKKAPIEKILEEEGLQLLAAAPPHNRLIALDREGKTFDTLKLSQYLQKWLLESQDVSFLIGGAEGISPTCLKQCQEIWSCSQLTFPHPLMRIIMAEQIYRAWTILKKHPYHRN